MKVRKSDLNQKQTLSFNPHLLLLRKLPKSPHHQPLHNKFKPNQPPKTKDLVDYKQDSSTILRRKNLLPQVNHLLKLKI
jgi:hypothetical protein